MDSPQRRIKIAHIITRMDWGGSPDIVRMLCTRLDQERYEPWLITGPTRFPSAKTRGFFEAFGSRIITVDTLQRRIRPREDLKAYRQLKRLILSGGYDIVHTHTAKAGFLGRMAAHAAGVPHIVHTPHGHNLYGYFNPLMTCCIRLLERYASRRCERIIVQTGLEERDLIASRIAMQGQTVVIPQGVELSNRGEAVQADALRSELSLEAHATVVIMIGRLERIKGAEFFVEAAALCCRRQDGGSFLLVGEGSLHARLAARISEQGLEQRIRMAGWRDDIPEILALTDIVVLPSLNEAVGMTLIEAQACGIPVVATRVGGIPEVVREGESGLLVAPADAPALAEAIGMLLRDSRRRRIMGEAGRAWVRDRFDVDRMIQRTEEVYEELMNS